MNLQMEEQSSNQPQQSIIPPTLRYLIPQSCYQLTLHQHHDNMDKNQQVINNVLKQQYKNYMYIISNIYSNPHLFDYRFICLKQLEQKSSIRPINSILVSPEIINKQGWKLLCDLEWQQFEQNNPRFDYKIPIIYQQRNLYAYLQQQFINLTIVFQSHYLNKAFVGYLPQNINASQAVRIIGYELGFSDFNSSEATIIESQWTLSFNELQQYKAKIFQSKTIVLKNVNIGQQNTSSMAAQHSGIENWSEYIQNSNFQQHESASTGIGTFFRNNGHDRNNRIRIFSQKEAYEITQMKNRAKQTLQGPRIPLPTQSKEQLLKKLEQIANQSLAGIHY